MKSITIHALDNTLDARIRERAKAEGKSLNKTIKGLLEEALGLSGKKSRDHREDFMDLYGSWAEADVEEFEQATRDLRQVDAGDWQ